MSIRARLNEALKDAMKAKDTAAVATTRLILAALKDRDIAARSGGVDAELNDDQIMQLLQSMVKQRGESIKMYKEGKREDLAAREELEISIIKTFLPEQMDDAAMAEAVAAVVAETGAQNLKDMGKVMAALKERHTGRMDFSKASKLVKEKLG
ncbi:MAG: GatB/YqeY domain-containing protein [Rhodospirillales bacterium]